MGQFCVEHEAAHRGGEPAIDDELLAIAAAAVSGNESELAESAEPIVDL
jgi:hypothetical protein